MTGHGKSITLLQSFFSSSLFITHHHFLSVWWEKEMNWWRIGFKLQSWNLLWTVILILQFLHSQNLLHAILSTHYLILCYLYKFDGFPVLIGWLRWSFDTSLPLSCVFDNSWIEWWCGFSRACCPYIQSESSTRNGIPIGLLGP